MNWDPNLCWNPDQMQTEMDDHLEDELGSELMLRYRPDVEPGPDDHLGDELGSELMLRYRPDVEPGPDDHLGDD